MVEISEPFYGGTIAFLKNRAVALGTWFGAAPLSIAS
jgi:hypothetical protein